jgi:peptide-methionine (S)-S-oxide reductase
MTRERAVLAGGCFWGMQDLIRRLPGVISTRVGYTGGDGDNATYRNHGTHAEAIEITFDAQKTSFRTLLAGTPGLFGASTERLHVPFRQPKLEAADANADEEHRRSAGYSTMPY